MGIDWIKTHAAIWPQPQRAWAGPSIRFVCPD
jgi:hypothetical protein